MSVTGGDRERAASIVGSMSPWRDLLAVALAEEREKARAPFLALLPELDEELDSYGYAIRNGLKPSPADRIRRAAGENE